MASVPISCCSTTLWKKLQRGGPGRAGAPPSHLLAVPNVTVHPSTASVPTLCCSTTLWKKFKFISIMTLYETRSTGSVATEQSSPQPCQLGLQDWGIVQQQVYQSRVHSIDEAAFAMCLAWHWPDHHWQCIWRVVWASLRMHAGKRQTLWAIILTIFNHMTRDISVFVKCGTIFIFFCKLPQIRTFASSAAICWRYGGKYYMGFVGNLVLFQQGKNFENRLRIDKVMSLV